jgi:hypothetical protein
MMLVSVMPSKFKGLPLAMLQIKHVCGVQEYADNFELAMTLIK